MPAPRRSPAHPPRRPRVAGRRGRPAASAGLTAADPGTPDPSTADPTPGDAAAPTGADPTAADPTAADPTTADPTAARPSAVDPATADPSAVDPATADPTAVDPATADPTAADPTTADPTAAGPSAVDPATADPTAAGADADAGCPAAAAAPPRTSPSGPARQRPQHRLRVAAVALAVLAVVLAALAVVLAQAQRRLDARAEAAGSVLPPAKTAAARILSYDHRHLTQDSAAAAELLTGAYKGQYEDAMRKLIIPQAPKQQAVVSAEVLSAGVSSVNQDATQAVVVVFANQTVSTASLTQPRVDQLRVRLTMDRVDGRWLVSKIDSL